MKPAFISLSIILSFLSFTASALAYVDLSVNYHFTQRKIDGTEPTARLPNPGEAVSTTEGWSGNWGWYIWDYTALEFNYSRSKERLVDDRETMADETLTIKEVDSVVETQVLGAGIRQSFAHRKALLVPSLAVGYARLITSGRTSYTLDDAGTERRLVLNRDKEVFNSSYVTAQLRIRFTELMGLSLAAKSVMPDFDTSKAADNLTYSAGFSLLF